MDLVMVGMFALMRMPLGIFFAFIGDAVGAGLAGIGITGSSGIPLGAVIHYVLGSILGAFFLAGVNQIAIFRMETIIQCVVVSIIYIEIVSVLLQIPAVLILKMSSVEMARLFGMAVFLNGIWGIVFGIIISRRLS